MTAKILDGKIVREKIASRLARDTRRLKGKPRLAIIQVGRRPESDAYIRQKKLFSERIDAKVTHKRYPGKISEKKIISEIQKLNKNSGINGIIVQLPLPARLNASRIIEIIDPRKDVDGMTAVNMRKLLAGENDGFVPATTKGILSLLDYYEIPVVGKKVVIVGRSLLVGRPTELAFLNRNATVTVCHRRTKNLAEETKRTDILIVAAGKPGLIGRKHVSPGQTVIDVGINRVGGKILGDVQFAAVKKIVRALTPVPGGVGPITVGALFENLLSASRG